MNKPLITARDRHTTELDNQILGSHKIAYAYGDAHDLRVIQGLAARGRAVDQPRIERLRELAGVGISREEVL
jgi:hypothetical protein